MKINRKKYWKLAVSYSLAMVEVFKTDVDSLDQAIKIIDLLSKHFPGCKINFDLEDCDKVLRMEGAVPDTNQVIILLKKYGAQCIVLE